jgi:hypothetical protein
MPAWSSPKWSLWTSATCSGACRARPDVIPLMGYADDAIIVTAVLRGITRRLILAVDEKST